MSREERFAFLFEAHYAAVGRYLRSRGHQGADSDDLIAVTFEVAWRRFESVPPGREALPWLIAVARNQSRNVQRRSRRESALLADLARETPEHAELAAEARSELARVIDALARLKPLDRELVLLVAWHELSPAEAGAVLGLRANAARSRLHRARRRLSETLSAAGHPRPSALLTPTIDLGEHHDR